MKAAAALTTIGLLAAGAPAGSPGLQDLIDRLGEGNQPTGAGLTVGQVEAPNSSGDYLPNENIDAFDGQAFLPQSGPSGTSGHATTVGKRFYGTNGVAPGIDFVLSWEAVDWLSSDLNGLGGLPSLPNNGERIYNHSWVGDAPDNQSNPILRHADWLVANENVIMVSGTNNGGDTPKLMVSMFNGISVGVNNGGHASSDVPNGLDSSGRMKPEMTAPAGATSFAAPKVAGGAALMIETAQTHPVLMGNANADRNEIIKAVLMAGAIRNGAWTNNAPTSGPDRGITDRPLDEVFGAGKLDVNVAHLILTGGEQDGAVTPSSGGTITENGWDLATIDAGGSRYYHFSVNEAADAVSLLATWNRRVPNSFNSYSLADVDLTMWRVECGGSLQSITGEAGSAYFDSGNVVSESDVDNVELLHVVNLQPGEYVVELERVDNMTSEPHWDVALAWHLPEQIEGDLNGDGEINVPDLLSLLEQWGECPTDSVCPADLDGDCTVSVPDLLTLLGNWTF